MRTTLILDDTLMREALSQTGARTKTEVVEMGLRALLDREARRRLAALFGKVPGIKEIKRRRP